MSVTGPPSAATWPIWQSLTVKASVRASGDQSTFAGARVVGVRPRRDVGDLSPVVPVAAHREDLDAIGRLGLKRDLAIVTGNVASADGARHERRNGDRPEHRREAAPHSRLSVDVCSHPRALLLAAALWPHS